MPEMASHKSPTRLLRDAFHQGIDCNGSVPEVRVTITPESKPPLRVVGVHEVDTAR